MQGAATHGVASRPSCTGLQPLAQQATHLGQRLELDPDRQSALQLGQQVTGLAEVEGARCDEKDVVGVDVAHLVARPVAHRLVHPIPSCILWERNARRSARC